MDSHRRGLELEGSVTHRLLLPDGSWRRLDELQLGDRVVIGGGGNLWAANQVRARLAAASTRSLCAEAATRVGVDIETVIRYRAGVRGRHSGKLGRRLSLRLRERSHRTESAISDAADLIRVPELLDEKFAAFLGYLIGDGHISECKRTIGLTTGDEAQADRFAQLTEELFGLKPRKKWDTDEVACLVQLRSRQGFPETPGAEDRRLRPARRRARCAFCGRRNRSWRRSSAPTTTAMATPGRKA